MTILNAPPRTTLAYQAASTGPGVVWKGGPGTFSAEATWGGGTVTLQVQTGLNTWVAVGTDTTMIANGIAGFILPNGSVIRALIATATAVCAYVTPMS